MQRALSTCRRSAHRTEDCRQQASGGLAWFGSDKKYKTETSARSVQSVEMVVVTGKRSPRGLFFLNAFGQAFVHLITMLHHLISEK